MASLLTSLYVDTHGVIHGAYRKDGKTSLGNGLPEKLETMPEYFRAHGYDTACVQSNDNLGKELGFAQGFSDAHFQFAKVVTGRVITDAALSFLTTLRPPFFLYAHYMDAHFPYSPPPDMLSAFPAPAPPAAGDREDMNENINLGVKMDFLLDQAYTAVGVKSASTYPPMSEAGKEYIRYLYDCDVRYLDDCLDRLIGTIREAFPNTIFVVLADHGEEFWEHGGMGHGTSMYEEQLSVPFMIQAPRLAPRRIPETVNTIDLLPTLAGLLGFAPRNVWQGGDLFAEGRPLGGPVFSCTRGLSATADFSISAIVENNAKLIVNRTSDARKLFDLTADPGETSDQLSTAAPDRVTALSSHLDAHEVACVAAATMKPVAQPTLQEINDLTTLERLYQLGYISEKDYIARKEELSNPK